MNIIELKKVNYQINNESILREINLKIKQKELLLILGRNGVGKSQLAKLLGGLINHFSGEYFFKEEKTNPQKLLGKEVGFLFQEVNNQFFSTIVKNDLAFGLENKQIPAKKMDQIIDQNLAKLKMEQAKEKNIHLLSEGEKQKIAIAAILSLESEILIFDEPTSMLDRKGKKNFLRLIKMLKKQEKTIILISHNLENINLADRIIILEDGKIVQNLPKKKINDKILTTYNLI